MSDASAVRTRRKFKEGRPQPPYPEFPLSPHSSGSWVKKINGKIHYFGRWGRRVKGQLVPVDGGGWKEAPELYRQIGPDLHAGRRPRANKRAADPTIGDVCNDFYESKKQLLENHGITRRAFADYVRTTDLVVAEFGRGRPVEDLQPVDFRELRAALAKRFGPVRLANEIGRIKTVFKHAFENRLISSQVFYGREFDKPKLRDLRLVKATNSKSHEIKPDELRRLIDAAAHPLRAMILLGINCGFGNTDCASLPLSAVDLDRGWISCSTQPNRSRRRGEVVAIVCVECNQFNAGHALVLPVGWPVGRSIDGPTAGTVGL